MGAQKITVRTLPNGQKVHHHPDGRRVLVPANRLAEALSARQDALREAHDELVESQQDRVRRKRERLAADPSPVSPDKRCC